MLIGILLLIKDFLYPILNSKLMSINVKYFSDIKSFFYQSIIFHSYVED